jgi:myo-inositol-1(or 4)-monophosphatase
MQPGVEYETIRLASFAWIRQAGEIARRHFGHAVTSRKADRSFVTDADHAVQADLLASIARHHPGDAVISEETQAAPEQHRPVAAARRCWVVDPIDGTRSYARGFPGFCVSVGLLEAGRPVVGLIYNPLTGQMYSASAGGGAWLDGQRITATRDPLSRDTLLAIPSRSRSGLPPVAHRWMDRMVIRNLGSTALHLALLACGAVDAVYADECHLWDVTAGAVMVEEAGARLLSIEGKPYFPIDLGTHTNQAMPFLAAGPAALERLVAEYRDIQ